MSVLVDRLKQITQGVPQPMGFRLGAKAPSRPKVQLVCLVSPENGKDTTETVGTADVIVFRGANGLPSEDILKPYVEAKIPFGIELSGGAVPDVESLAKGGADFVVFTADMPVGKMLESDVGKIIRVDPSFSDGMLRAVNALAVDGVLLWHRPAGAALTWEDLLVYQRMGGFISRPLLLPAPGQITPKELQSLTGAGVAAVVFDTDGHSTTGLRELRKMIDELKPPAPVRKGMGSALAPRVTPEPEQHEDQDEEEDE